MTSPPSRNPSGCASVRECHPSRLIHALGRTYVLRDGSFAAEGCVDLHWLTVLGDHRSERDPWISRVSRPTVSAVGSMFLDGSRLSWGACVFLRRHLFER